MSSASMKCLIHWQRNFSSWTREYGASSRVVGGVIGVVMGGALGGVMGGAIDKHDMKQLFN